MNTSNITNYKPKDFAELLGVSVKTLQRWDREGTLKANRTPTDRRYYTYDQYLQFKGINTEDDQRQVVIYARVSTRNQKDDLQNQVTFLRQFCNAKGIIVDQCIEDYGSGLNYVQMLPGFGQMPDLGREGGNVVFQALFVTDEGIHAAEPGQV